MKAETQQARALMCVFGKEENKMDISDLDLGGLEVLANSGDADAVALVNKIQGNLRFGEELVAHVNEMHADVSNGRELTDAEQHWLTATESLMLERGWIDETIN